VIKNPSLNKKGFTLLETIFAIIILSIALIAILSFFSANSFFIIEIKERFIAAQAAQEEMELIRDMAFDDILMLSSSFTATGFSSLKDPIGTLTVDNPYGIDDMRRITITVAWTSSKGRTFSRSLVTLVTREGINRQ